MSLSDDMLVLFQSQRNLRGQPPFFRVCGALAMGRVRCPGALGWASSDGAAATPKGRRCKGIARLLLCRARSLAAVTHDFDECSRATASKNDQYKILGNLMLTYIDSLKLTRAFTRSGARSYFGADERWSPSSATIEAACARLNPDGTGVNWLLTSCCCSPMV